MSKGLNKGIEKHVANVTVTYFPDVSHWCNEVRRWFRDWAEKERMRAIEGGR